MTIFAEFVFTKSFEMEREKCGRKGGQPHRCARQKAIVRPCGSREPTALHLSLDRLSLAGHVLVVSPYTSSRVVGCACTYAARYVSARRYAHRPLRLAMPKRPTGMSADGNLRGGGIEGSSREEFKEQIDRNLSQARPSFFPNAPAFGRDFSEFSLELFRERERERNIVR